MYYCFQGCSVRNGNSAKTILSKTENVKAYIEKKFFFNNKGLYNWAIRDRVDFRIPIIWFCSLSSLSLFNTRPKSFLFLMVCTKAGPVHRQF